MRAPHLISFILVVGAASFALPCTLAQASDVETTYPKYLSDEISRKSDPIDVLGWKLLPSFSAGVGWTDNIETEPRSRDDVSATTTDRFELRRNLGDIETRLNGSIYGFKPAATPSENDFRGDLSLDLQGDLSASVKGRLNVGFSDLRPEMGTIDVDHEQIFKVRPSVTIEDGKNTYVLRGTIGTVKYLDSPFLNSGASSDPRQRKFAQVDLMARRELTTRVSAYVGALMRGTVFDNSYDTYGLRRGDRGEGLYAGVRADLTDTVKTDLSLGYIRQTFQEQSFQDKGYLTVNGWLQWTPINSLRLTLSEETDFVEDVKYASAGILERETTMRGEYQAAEKLVLVAETGYENADYLYSGISQRTFSVASGVDYSFSPHWLLSTRYGVNFRKSEDPNENYTQNVLFAGIRYN